MNRYAFAVMFIKTQINGTCDVYKLRLFNVFALLFTMIYACDCRALISSRPGTAIKNLKAGIVSWETLHTALNIALFPPLFFFSGLFYTDVLSTAMVLRMYRLFLQGGGKEKEKEKVWLYLTGMVALTMRQTNIFWVAVFMGGLEAVRTIEENKSPALSKEPVPKTWQEHVVSRLKKWSRGEIHDIYLRDAAVHGEFPARSSLRIHLLTPCPRFHTLRPQYRSSDHLQTRPDSDPPMAIHRPPRLVRRLRILERRRRPRYLSLLSSLMPCTHFFPTVLTSPKGDKSNHVATIHLPQLLYIWPFITFFSAPLILPRAFSSLLSTTTTTSPSSARKPEPTWKYVLNAVYMTAALVVTLGIVKYNTIIHPFTLADNRHYIFYAFRYSILRHPAIRYLLAPVYLICAYLISLTLSSPSPTTPEIPNPQSQPPTSTTPKTSLVLILLATTTLSLVTAPLVEPRYFIIPWVLWRLHVPVNSNGRGKGKGKGRGVLGCVYVHDWRLWGETGWFVLVGGATGYVFLWRGFEWRQEAGVVQRFMW